MVLCVFNLETIALSHHGHVKECIKALDRLRIWAPLLSPDLIVQISLLGICLQGPAKF